MPDTLAGRHVLITAGPTREPIDPVRFISNHSSGKQGYAIASACAALGARVTLVAGPTALDDPDNVNTVHVETARDMLAAVERALPADIFIAVAAVADWRPAEPADRKLKLDKASFSSLPLVENPDILKTISQMDEGRPDLVIGFAAETHDVEALAIAKRTRKGCDWIVANDVSGDVMGGAENAVLLVTETGSDAWERAEKSRIAELLASRIASAL
ncbi:MAG: phosphopantothenoylcysteine decarboxylase [Maricaulis sp.]|nr:phosphopantothenoylcysteine decarboxylase [Maricaulis sp.]MDF1767575.1 phosphopantothenoylcysteine decarboxylase [Maricaulis sp.]